LNDDKNCQVLTAGALGAIARKKLPKLHTGEPAVQIKISRFMFLEKRKSRDFFTHTNQKSREKNLEKKNLEIFGGHLAKFFCEVNLEIFISQYLRFVIHSSKSRDFLY